MALASAYRARLLDLVGETVRAQIGSGVAMYLVGSWARGAEQQSSDLDIALDSPVPLSPVVLANVREALEQAPVPVPVDVIDLCAVSTARRERLMREAVPWSV